jgi:hypothetical protein
MALFKSPIPKNAGHNPLLFGMRSFKAKNTAQSVMAAMPTRPRTIVKAGKSRTAIPLKKKDPPHSTESAINMAHSRAPMMVWTVDAAGNDMLGPILRNAPQCTANGGAAPSVFCFGFNNPALRDAVNRL